MPEPTANITPREWNWNVTTHLDLALMEMNSRISMLDGFATWCAREYKDDQMTGELAQAITVYWSDWNRFRDELLAMLRAERVLPAEKEDESDA